MRELMSGRGERDLVPGHLRLYRTWRIATDPALPLRFSRPFVLGVPMVPLEDVAVSLMSTGWPVTWSGEMTAECMRMPAAEGRDLHVVGENGLTRPHGSAPEAGCSCGVYGWYDPRDTRMVSAPIIGAIDAWGRCVLGSNGAKVEHARLLAIAPNPFDPLTASSVFRDELGKLLARLADEGYRVYPSYDALIEDLPPVSVTALAGDPAPIGQMLDAQERIAELATVGASASHAVEQFGIAMAAGILQAAGPAHETWSMRLGRNAQLIVAGLMVALAVADVALGSIRLAAFPLGWAAFNYMAWRTGSLAPWRWFRGSRRRA